MHKNESHNESLRGFFQVKCKTSNFFVFIERILPFLRSGIGYKFRYDGCTGTYYGKTKRHIKVRLCEHLGIWTLTWKRVKGDAIKEHLWFCNHSPDFDYLSTLTNNNNEIINRDHPSLNKNKQSFFTYGTFW